MRLAGDEHLDLGRDWGRRRAEEHLACALQAGLCALVAWSCGLVDSRQRVGRDARDTVLALPLGLAARPGPRLLVDMCLDHRRRRARVNHVALDLALAERLAEELFQLARAPD